MDGQCLEMDLTMRSRDETPQEISCKMRMAKSVFSIRSLVDLGENGQQLEEKENDLEMSGE